MPISDTDPIVTVPLATPFDEQDRVDRDALVHNVQKWLGTPLGGFIVGTATGEEWFLSEAEKLEIAATVHQQLDPQRFLIGGIDCPSVTETLRRAEAFASAGAELVRVRIPRYESTVEDYFEQLLPRCPVPVLVMHQCNPERFGYAGAPAATPQSIGRICNMENVFGYVTDHDLPWGQNTQPDLNSRRETRLSTSGAVDFGPGPPGRKSRPSSQPESTAVLRGSLGRTRTKVSFG